MNEKSEPNVSSVYSVETLDDVFLVTDHEFEQYGALLESGLKKISSNQSIDSEMSVILLVSCSNSSKIWRADYQAKLLRNLMLTFNLLPPANLPNSRSQ
ncbi:hypothetical protein ACOME3_008449 [Neoechinorhynchus agilis]